MDLKFVRTTCPYCGCGCEMLLEVMDGTLLGTLPSKTNPMNKGRLCIKGWNAHEFVQSPSRLTKPLMRKNGKLEEVSWDEALDYIAVRLKEIKSKNGADALAGLSSARCTNEENYVFQKFIRAAVGTNNVDHCARL